MYICLCNGITDSKARAVIASGAASRCSEVYAACGCRAQCGTCTRSIVAMLHEAGLAAAAACHAMQKAA